MGLFGFGRKKKESRQAVAERTVEMSAEAMYTQGEELYKKNDFSAAMPLIQKAAEMGFAPAQNHLGVDYARGEGVPKDIQKALYWYQKACDQDHVKALQNMALMYEKGSDVPQDYKKAAALMTRAAELGYDRAQNSLGIMYEDGIGVPKDIEKAIYWYQKACDQDHVKALWNMAFMYKTGSDVPQDYKKAAALMTRSAELGYDLAQNSLGIMYEEGTGVPQSYEEARKWYQKAIDQGHAKAYYNLGRLYYCGYGVPVDLMKTREYWQKAAELGDKVSRDSLDKYLHCNEEAAKTQKTESSAKPVFQEELLLQEAVAAYRKENWAEALKYFEKAAKLGHPYAAFLTAEMYLRPDLLDYSQAETWAEKASDKGYAGAQKLLQRIWSDAGRYYLDKMEAVREAYLYEHLHSMPFEELRKAAAELPKSKRFEKQAIAYYTKSAEHGDTWSMVSLANYYYWNPYFDEDSGCLEKAANWIERAKQLGNETAKVLYPWICRQYYSSMGLKYSKTDDTMNALIYFRKGAEAGDSSCMYNAAVCLYNRYSDYYSMKEALEWAMEAEKHGVKNADRLVQSIKRRL